MLEKLAIGKAKSLQGLNGDEPFARRLSVLAADFEFRDPFALTLHLPLDEADLLVDAREGLLQLLRSKTLPPSATHIRSTLVLP